MAILKSKSGASYNTKTGKKTSSTGAVSYQKTNTSSSGSKSSNNALAQQAVDKGYVKSVAEYNAAESAGKAGAKYGYTNTGTSSKPNYTANTSPIGIKEMQQDVVAPELPTPAPVDNLNSTIESTNIGLGLNADGSAKTTVEAPKSAVETFLSQSGITAPDAPESGADAYLKAQKELGIKQKQQEVNNYQSQLNAIVAKSQADQLRVEGQGRGIPEAIIGGQQAQISKEAAIQALPVQAQLAAAQGNLEMAQKTLDTYYQIKSQDIQNTYNYKMKLYDTALSIATTQQQNAIEDKRMQAQFKQQRDMAYLDYDLAVKKASIGGGTTKRDTSWQDLGNGQKVLVDNQTGEVISTPGGGTGSQDQVQKSLDQFSFLRDTIKGANDLANKAGPNMITKGLGNFFVGNTGVKQLQKKLDTLKVNLLTLNTDPNVKKFFGPQMTERDTELMTSAGTTMDAYVNTPEDLKAELKRYDDLINRMQTAVRLGNEGFSTQITAPDGNLIQIID